MNKIVLEDEPCQEYPEPEEDFDPIMDLASYVAGDSEMAKSPSIDSLECDHLVELDNLAARYRDTRPEVLAEQLRDLEDFAGPIAALVPIASCRVDPAIMELEVYSG